MLKQNHFTSIDYPFDEDINGKILIIGIGGGNDVVGAYALGKFLKTKYSNIDINIAVAITPKANYESFDLLCKNVYQVNKKYLEKSSKLHHTLELIKDIDKFDNSFPIYALVRPKYETGISVEKHKKEVAEVIKKSLTFLNPVE